VVFLWHSQRLDEMVYNSSQHILISAVIFFAKYAFRNSQEQLGFVSLV
jgi:hypothetical protein